MTGDERMELLSALLDGEEGDPQELVAALTQPGAREALRDFAVLRTKVREDEDRPSAAFYERIEQALTGAPPVRAWWRQAIPVPAPALIAASLVAALLLGWAFRGRQDTRVEQPPPPDRIVQFVSGVDWNPQER